MQELDRTKKRKLALFSRSDRGYELESHLSPHQQDGNPDDEFGRRPHLWYYGLFSSSNQSVGGRRIWRTDNVYFPSVITVQYTDVVGFGLVIILHHPSPIQT